MKQFHYDLVVIGGGSGGLVAAKLAQGLGKKVLLLEKNKLGGECTWTGCVPSKTLIHCANSIYNARIMKNHGFLFSETIDSEALMNHVRKTIQKIYSNETPEIIQKNGINVVFGSASFLDTTTISVNDTKITSDKFIIATGSKPFIPSIEGLNSISYLTNETIFELKKLPSSMIILGGGPIGIELACALNQ
jgi:pyruvate/2-oxoglutarate dehydrogenase complex dihydrolipoamide dehydrogenase (E3) component